MAIRYRFVLAWALPMALLVAITAGIVRECSPAVRDEALSRLGLPEDGTAADFLRVALLTDGHQEALERIEAHWGPSLAPLALETLSFTNDLMDPAGRRPGAWRTGARPPACPSRFLVRLARCLSPYPPGPVAA